MGLDPQGILSNRILVPFFLMHFVLQIDYHQQALSLESRNDAPLGVGERLKLTFLM